MGIPIAVISYNVDILGKPLAVTSWTLKNSSVSMNSRLMKALEKLNCCVSKVNMLLESFKGYIPSKILPLKIIIEACYSLL